MCLHTYVRTYLHTYAHTYVHNDRIFVVSNYCYISMFYAVFLDHVQADTGMMKYIKTLKFICMLSLQIYI